MTSPGHSRRSVFSIFPDAPTFGAPTEATGAPVCCMSCVDIFPDAPTFGAPTEA